jgi:signal transduction histidine kinase
MPIDVNRAPPSYRGAMRLGYLIRRYGFDALVVVVALGSLIEVWVTDVPGARLVLIPAIVGYTLPLLLRHRFPFGAPAFVFAVQALVSFADSEAVGSMDSGVFALLLTFWVAGAQRELGKAIVATAIGFASIWVIVARDVRVTAAEASSFLLVAGGLSLVAFVLHRRELRADEAEARAAELERDREEQARAAVAEERIRIARELHDVIAHCVSVMTVQATAARLLLDDEPERAREPLLAVEDTGRQTLAEMRRLLGILRKNLDESGPTPQPRMADLGALLERCKGAGLPVELEVRGEPEVLTPGVDLAAYRVVQEALTNAIKHAGPAHAKVTVRYGEHTLDLDIVDDGKAAPVADGHGHGLVGMRERVVLYGGEFEAGPRATGGYAVHARLPLESQP